MNKTIDYLIIGQGLAGSILGYTLLEKGKKVLVLDAPKLQHCSKIAAGICNPITGRNLVRTWKAKELFSFLNDFYPKLEDQFQQKFFFKTPIYRPFQNLEQQQDWSAHEDKINEEVIYPKERFLQENIHDEFGGLLIKNGGHLRTDIFLEAIKNYLLEKEAYQEEVFEFENLEIQNNRVVYKNSEANHIIFCRGAADKTNPFFEKLPIFPAKGEILHVDISHDEDVVQKLNQIILNKGCWLVPYFNYKNENYLNDKVKKEAITTFRTGSNYDHKDLTLQPTQKAREEIETKLQAVLNLDYQVKKQEVGIRPATRTRKPLIGTHKDFKQIHIFNGFGAKGSSMIPYFAHQFSEYLLNNGELDREVRIEKWFLK